MNKLFFHSILLIYEAKLRFYVSRQSIIRQKNIEINDFTDERYPLSILGKNGKSLCKIQNSVVTFAEMVARKLN